jgi:hypothetical protein
VTIFDINAQRDNDRKNLSESVFAYLNRSAKRGSVASRALIEEWLRHVPTSERREFCARFRSGDNIQFGTAFQELFLHEFLRCQKCALDFHPSIPGSSKRPDFLVCQPCGNSFILEARTSTDVASGPESNPRGDRIRDFLRHLKLDGYKLGIDEFTAGTRDLPQKALRKHIVDTIAAHSGTGDGIIRIPDYSTADGWRIKLTAFSSARYGSSRSTTVMQEAWGRTWTGPSYPLREALKRKAGKYGPLTMPYVIAINSADVMLTDRDFEETLFGVRPGITIAGMTDELTRGFWGTGSAPKHRRVSAVLFTKNLWPATVLMGQVYTCLYLNPWAERPYDGLLTELPTFGFENGEAREYPGSPWHALMNLQPLEDSSLWD